MRKILLLFVTIISIYLGTKAQEVEWSLSANSKFGSYTPSFTLDKNNDIVFLESNSDSTFLLGDTLFSEKMGLHVYKVDKNGLKIWSKDIICSSYTSGSTITVDNENNIYVTGRTGTDTVYINDQYYVPNDATSNAFIWKMDSEGNTVFLNFFSASYIIGFYDFKADYNLNTYVCGAFEGVLNFMDTTLYSGIIREDEFTTEYFRDFIIAKFDKHGDLVFIKKLDGALSNSNAGYINEIELDNDLNIYAAGSFRDSLFVEDHYIYSSGNSDMILIKWDNDGNLIWTEKDISEEAGMSVSDLAIDNNDNIYVTGEIVCDTDFGDVSVPITGPYGDAFIVKYDNAGTALWAETIGASEYVCGGDGIDFFENGDVCWQGAYVHNSRIADTILYTTSGIRHVFNTFIARLDNQGNYKGVFTLNSESAAHPRGLQFGESDTMYIMEGYVGNITYNGRILNNEPCPINGDLCLIKFSYENEINDSSIFNISDPVSSCGGTEKKMTFKSRCENDQFGNSVGISQNTVIVGTRNSDYDLNESNYMRSSGLAYFFHINESGDIINYQKVIASDRDSLDNFGGTSDVYGNYAVIGAKGNDKGAAYIFEKDSYGIWNEKSKLVASDSAIVLNDLGTDLSISDKYAVVSNEYAKIPTSEQSGAIYIYQRDKNGDWTELQNIYPSNGASGDFFGRSVDIYSDYLIVGSPNYDYDENETNYIKDAGTAYIFKNNDDVAWEESQKLVPSIRKTRNNFGVSVAIDGKWAIVGASWDHTDEFNQDSLRVAGAAYMFEQDESGVWHEKQKLVAFDRAAEAIFGCKVDIYDSLAVVHAEDNKDENGENYIYNSGSVYLYKLNKVGYWDLVRKIVASDRAMNSTFGRSVKVWNDKIVIGDQYSKLNEIGTDPIDGAGAIYIIDNEFIEPVKKTLSICNGDSLFLEGEYQTLVGTYYDTLQTFLGCDSIIETLLIVNPTYYITESATIYIGESYTFPDGTVQDNNTSQIVYTSNLQTMLGCDSIIETTLSVNQNQNLIEQELSIQVKKQWDRFGNGVAIDYDKAVVSHVGTSERNGGYVYFYDYNGVKWEVNTILQGSDTKFNDIFGISADIDGDFAAVGARSADGNGLENTGAVYIFKFNGENWEEYSKIVASDIISGASFGMRVKLEGDVLAVSAPNANNSYGAAYIFKNIGGNWEEQQKLSPSNGQEGDLFGWSMDICKNNLIVGAQDNDTQGESSGTAYIYEYIANTWNETAVLLPVEVKAWDKFGSAVSISESVAIVGADWDEENGYQRRGSVYIYRKEATGWDKKKQITPPESKDYLYFGSSVDIEDNLAIIGSSGAENDSTYAESGEAYVYSIENDTTWTLQHKLFTKNGNDYDRYGDYVATDGNSIIVSAVDVDSSSVMSTGAAYIYYKECSIIKTYKLDTFICQGDGILIGGTYQYNPDTYYLTLTNINGCDSIVEFTLNINPVFNLSETDSICFGESYTFPDNITQNNITSQVIHVSKLQTVLGCDSIIETTVNVNPVYSLSETVIVNRGESYTFSDGITQNNIISQVIYTSNLQTIFGCDSIIETTVNVDCNPVFNISETDSICIGESYTFPDDTTQNNITSQVIHVSNLQTVLGCDSIIETTVNVNPIYSLSETVSIKSGSDYTFPDEAIQNNITSQVIYASYLQTIFGCDSIIETTVNVEQIQDCRFTEELTVCYGSDYLFPDGTTQNNITSQVVHESIIPSFFACDTIIETIVNVNQGDVTYLYDTICEGESIQVGYVICTGTGIYGATLTNQFGCDSIVNLDLIVIELDVDLGRDKTIDINDTIILDAGENFETYYWNTEETSQTILIDGSSGVGSYTFNVMVTDENDCTETDNITITISDITDISFNDDLEGDIKLYPNPTSGTINIDLTENNEPIEISIFDVTGKILLHKELNSNESSFVVEIPGDSGIYFIKLSSDLKSKTYKIIKD
ncbi:MAG: T9SS type A sorting domain-containing protein [Bacteroidales bacterium]|nr:T9SS type A sorting domain-containing protein [Bacteroidales bacterium]